ncbi:hypothetical protein B0H12DRAFT_1099478 [Mycena haematopus]|nr:hypothetical protein B0H12DRAFT_1099478 [Mycena haematopus]
MLIQGIVSALLLSLAPTASAQTLYTVSEGTQFNPWANATISVSAIGTGSDGGTTYVEVATAIPSFYVTQVEPNGQTLAAPVTVGVEPFTMTFVEDATGFRESGVGAAISVAETCTFGPDARGTCVDHIVFELQSSTTVLTVSGSVVPFYTLAASATAPANAAVQNTVFSSLGGVCIGFVVGLLCSL